MKTSEKLIETYNELKSAQQISNGTLEALWNVIEETESLERKLSQKSCKCTSKERCYGPYSRCQDCGKYHG